MPQQSTLPPGLLTLEQAAERLGYSTDALSRHLRKTGGYIGKECVGYQLGPNSPWRISERGVAVLRGERAREEQPLWMRLMEG